MYAVYIHKSSSIMNKSSFCSETAWKVWDPKVETSVTLRQRSLCLGNEDADRLIEESPSPLTVN